VSPRLLPGLGVLTARDVDGRSHGTPSGAQSSVLHELRDDDWAGKLKSAIFGREGVVDDVIRVLAARAAGAGQISAVLALWSDAIERKPAAAISIGQALPHLCDAAARTPADLAKIVKLFGQSLLRAHALDAKARGEPGTEVSRLAHALLGTDMAVPRAHGAIVEIVREHRSLLATDDVTWSFLAPLA